MGVTVVDVESVPMYPVLRVRVTESGVGGGFAGFLGDEQVA